MSVGNATLSCGSGKVCTETVHAPNNEEIILNTSVSFADGGECDAVRYLQLIYNSQVMWAINLTDLQTFGDSRIKLRQSFDSETNSYSFMLNTGNITVNNSGLYTVRVILRNSFNDLEKNFQINGN